MSKVLKLTFLIHALVAVLIGLPLLIIPGRFMLRIGWQGMLQALGWENTDPFVTRLLGAALLALAWGSLRGWRATQRAQIANLIEMEAIFTVLGCAGLLRHLMPGLLAELWLPAPGWAAFAILAIFALAWIVFLFRG
jgi:hypothetical protein